MVARLPRVAIVGTGGTIANTPQGRLTVEQLIDRIGERFPEGHPGIYADLTCTDVLHAGAQTFGWPEFWTVASAVREAAAESEIDGIVITHGTFTVEECAYFLHLVTPTRKPVVITCSQRKHSTVGNDGDRNLVDAVRVATDPGSTGMGVLLVANEEIHSARDVSKTSQRPSGFSSGSLGILGSVETDQVTFYRTPIRRHTSSSTFRTVDPFTELPRVDVVSVYPDADDVAIRAFIRAGARGLVIHGYAFDGSASPAQTPALTAAVDAGIAVVAASRGGDGRVPVSQPKGAFIAGDTLSAHKARVLLSLGLTRVETDRELQQIFSDY